MKTLDGIQSKLKRLTKQQTHDKIEESLFIASHKKSIAIYDYIIMSEEISSDAFYLFVILNSISPLLARTSVERSRLLEETGWATQKKFKKYFIELYNLGLIDSDNIEMEGHGPVSIVLTGNVPTEKLVGPDPFTPINLTTLIKLKEIGKEVTINKRMPTGVLSGTTHDMKEAVMRMAYLYEQRYLSNTNIIIPISYSTLSKLTGLNPHSVSSANKAMEEAKMLCTFRGKRLSEGRMREMNKYKFIQLRQLNKYRHSKDLQDEDS